MRWRRGIGAGVQWEPVVSEAMSYKNDLHSSILDGYQQGKIAFVKAREKVVPVIKTWYGESLNESLTGKMDRKDHIIEIW